MLLQGLSSLCDIGTWHLPFDKAADGNNVCKNHCSSSSSSSLLCNGPCGQPSSANVITHFRNAKQVQSSWGFFWRVFQLKSTTHYTLHTYILARGHYVYACRQSKHALAPSLLCVHTYILISERVCYFSSTVEY